MSDTNNHRNFTTHHHHATVNNHRNPPPKHNPSKTVLSIFLKLIIMSLIISLFLIFIGLAAILVLHVLLAGSFFHRRRRQAATPPPPTSYSLLELQTHLPGFRFSAVAANSGGDCSICLDCFKDEDICRGIPGCKHFFHAQCVDTWLMKVPNCPVCRTAVRLEVDRPADLVGSDEECKFLWAIGVGRQVVVDY